jgi:hypothetical protein
MLTITKRLTRFIWYAASSTISTLPWRTNARTIRIIRPDGNGLLSYDPTKSVNSLSTLTTGDILEVDSLTTSYDIDNGTAPTASSGNKALPVFSGPAGEALTAFAETYYFDQNATPSVTFSQGAGTVELSYDDGASWSALGTLISANNGFKVRVQHPNNAAFSATITLSY